MTSLQAQSHTSFDTGYSADCTEFCPLVDSTDYLACGTYQLTDETKNDSQIRKGKLYLFTVDPKNKNGLQQQQVIEGPAILDMKWSHSLVDNRKVLGVVDSIGGLALHHLTDQGRLESLGHCQVSEPDVLCLSLDWASRLNGDDHRIAISHSNGDLSIVSPCESEWKVADQWHAHDLEAWITAFNYWDTRTLYSGADDGLFKGWDSRSQTAQFTNKRHTMGVTTMQSSPFQEHTLVTGSYDENIYFWDTRSMRMPLNTVQTPGGGIWRLKWHPTKANILLSASMHAGAFVIDTNTQEIVHSFLDHTSMVYGADWSYVHNDWVASCSFYDHTMHLWDASTA